MEVKQQETGGRERKGESRCEQRDTWDWRRQESKTSSGIDRKKGD